MIQDSTSPSGWDWLWLGAGALTTTTLLLAVLGWTVAEWRQRSGPRDSGPMPRDHPDDQDAPRP